MIATNYADMTRRELDKWCALFGEIDEAIVTLAGLVSADEWSRAEALSEERFVVKELEQTLLGQRLRRKPRTITTLVVNEVAAIEIGRFVVRHTADRIPYSLLLVARPNGVSAEARSYLGTTKLDGLSTSAARHENNFYTLRQWNREGPEALRVLHAAIAQRREQH